MTRKTKQQLVRVCAIIWTFITELSIINNYNITTRINGMITLSTILLSIVLLNTIDEGL